MKRRHLKFVESPSTSEITSPYFSSSSATAATAAGTITVEASASTSESKPISRPGPANWELVYDNILEMRKELNAPVDSMGCERIHDRTADEKVSSEVFHLSLYIMFVPFYCNTKLRHK